MGWRAPLGLAGGKDSVLVGIFAAWLASLSERSLPYLLITPCSCRHSVTAVGWPNHLTERVRRKPWGVSPGGEAGLPWLEPLLLRCFCGTLVPTAGLFLGRSP